VNFLLTHLIYFYYPSKILKVLKGLYFALASSKKVKDCIHLKLIAKYCSYEKRRKGLNFTEQFEGVYA